MKLFGSIVFTALLIHSTLGCDVEDELKETYDKLKETVEKLKLSETKNLQLQRKMGVLEETVKKLRVESSRNQTQITTCFSTSVSQACHCVANIPREWTEAQNNCLRTGHQFVTLLDELESKVRSLQGTSSCPKSIGASSMCYSTSNPSRCYCIVYMPSTRSQADFRCFDRRAKLVSIETEAENEAIKKLFSTPDHFSRNRGLGTFLWTSGTDQDNKDRWIWTSTGQPLTGYTDWRSYGTQQPGEHYLTLHMASWGSKWVVASDDHAALLGADFYPLCEYV